MLRTETRDLLELYEKGEADVEDIRRWTVEFDEDDPTISQDEKELAGQLTILALEVLEGLRPKQELNEFIERALKVIPAR